MAPPKGQLPSASDPNTAPPESLEHPQPFVTANRPTGRILAMDFDSKGERLFHAGEDKTVWVSTAPDWVPTQRFHLRTWSSWDGEIFDLDVSPDDRFVAVSGCHGCSRRWKPEDTYLVFLLDADSGEILGVGDQYGPSRSLVFSPDGRYIATADGARQVNIFKVTKKGELFRDSSLAGHSGGISDLRWAPDGRSFYTVGEDGLLIKWSTHDIDGWYPEWHQAWSVGLVSLEISLDGRSLYVGTRDGRVEMADAKTGEAIENLLAIESGVAFGLILSEDGKRLVYGSGGGDGAKGWDYVGVGSIDLGDGAGTRFEKSVDTVIEIAWDGRSENPIAISPGPGAVRLHDAESLGLERVIEPPGLGIGWLSSWGNRIGYREQTDPEEGEGEDEAPETIVFDLNTLTQTTTTQTSNFRGGDGSHYDTIEDDDPAPGQITLREKGSYETIVYTIDSSQIRTWSVFGLGQFAMGIGIRLSMIDLYERSRLDCFGHNGRIHSVAWMRRGLLLLSTADDRTLRIWNADTCELLGTLFDDGAGEWAIWTPEALYAHSEGGRDLLGFRVNRGPRETPVIKTPNELPELHQPERIIEILRKGTARPPEEVPIQP